MKTLTYLCLATLLCVSTPQLFAYSSLKAPVANADIQRVRIDITTPLGYTRHLLLGFTPDNAASDGFDYGYDAQNIDNYANDCNWIINDNRYVIQGVGAFHESKTYPLGLFLTDAGNVEFSLLALENFNQSIAVYIYDALNDTVFSISDTNHIETISEGSHINRFYITFTNDTSLMSFPNNQLSTEEFVQETTTISYIASTKALHIKTSNVSEIEEMSLYSVLGKRVKFWSDLKLNSTGILKVPVANISQGTYILRLKTKRGFTNKRLIISKS